MLRYELMMLASPEITKDEEANLEKQIDVLIDKAKGSILAFDRWGKYRLEYPVKGNDYGVYFLVRFDIEDRNVFEEFRRMFYVKFNDIVMRHLVSKLDAGSSLEYKRPPSLEDTPKRHIGFLEESELKHGSTSLRDDKKKERTFRKASSTFAHPGSSLSSAKRVQQEKIKSTTAEKVENVKIKTVETQESAVSSSGKQDKKEEKNTKDDNGQEV